MARRADNEQVDLQIGRKRDDIAYGMSGKHMGVEFYVIFFGQRARALVVMFEIAVPQSRSPLLHLR